MRHAHHAHAAQLLALAQWVAEQTGATIGYLTEAANTVGAQWVRAQPQKGGRTERQVKCWLVRCKGRAFAQYRARNSIARQVPWPA